MKKSFKLSHRPGQTSPTNTTASLPAFPVASEETKPTVRLEPGVRRSRSHGSPAVKDFHSSQALNEPFSLPSHSSLTTRKTIEVPEDYFFRVKMHALQRRI